jgi:hypothetical protein
MCPIHSAGRRRAASAFNEPSLYSSGGQRPGHHAGGEPVQSIGRWRVHTAACSALMMARALPRKQPREVNTVSGTDITTLGDRPDVTGVSYFPPFCPWLICQGPVPLYVPPLVYKREGTRRYKADPHRLIQTPAIPDTTQAQKQYNTQWSRVLRSSGPNHSKLLRVLACSSRIHLTGKTLRPPPHLRI